VLRLGEGGTGRRLGILGGIASLGQAEPVLSDVNKGEKSSVVLAVPPRLTLQKCVEQRRTCLFIYEGASDFLLC